MYCLSVYQSVRLSVWFYLSLCPPASPSLCVIAGNIWYHSGRLLAVCVRLLLCHLRIILSLCLSVGLPACLSACLCLLKTLCYSGGWLYLSLFVICYLGTIRSAYFSVSIYLPVRTLNGKILCYSCSVTKAWYCPSVCFLMSQSVCLSVSALVPDVSMTLCTSLFQIVYLFVCLSVFYLETYHATEVIHWPYFYFFFAKGSSEANTCKKKINTNRRC